MTVRIFTTIKEHYDLDRTATSAEHAWILDYPEKKQVLHQIMMPTDCILGNTDILKDKKIVT